jgi:hypothetical protein
MSFLIVLAYGLQNTYEYIVCEQDSVHFLLENAFFFLLFQVFCAHATAFVRMLLRAYTVEMAMHTTLLSHTQGCEYPCAVCNYDSD